MPINLFWSETVTKSSEEIYTNFLVAIFEINFAGGIGSNVY